MAGMLLREVLYRLSRAPAGEQESDSRLLAKFVQARDDIAFEQLVWRHGPMVLSVCRRMLRREQDAEDAFQATFLALAREAGRVSRGEMLAAWLQRVAFRTAVKLREGISRLNTLPPDELPPGQTPMPEPELNELHAILDEEVSRLPARYRQVFTLCCLSGQSNTEAALELGCPRGTVDSRLAWAKRRLRARLLRRGIGPAAVAGALELTADASGAVPAILVRTTVQASLGFLWAEAAVPAVPALLARGVIHAMMIERMKHVALVVFVAVAMSAGAGWVSYSVYAGDTPSVAQTPTPKSQPPAKPAARPATDGMPGKPRPEAKTPPKTPAPALSGIEALSSKLSKTVDIEKPIHATLRDVLEFLSDRFDMTIIVDRVAFKNGEPPLEDVEGQHINLPKLPGVRVNTVLRLVLSQIGGTIVLRDGHVEVTTVKAARDRLGFLPGNVMDWTGEPGRPPLVYAEPVFLAAKEMPFSDAVREIAEMSGANIVIDVRAKELAKTPVTASLRQVPLRSALRVLADMVELKVVAIDNILYVTTPENAEKLAREEAASAKTSMSTVPPPKKVEEAPKAK